MKSKNHNPGKVEDGKLISIKYLSDKSPQKPAEDWRDKQTFCIKSSSDTISWWNNFQLIADSGQVTYNHRTFSVLGSQRRRSRSRLRLSIRFGGTNVSIGTGVYIGVNVWSAQTNKQIEGNLAELDLKQTSCSSELRVKRLAGKFAFVACFPFNLCASH